MPNTIQHRGARQRGLKEKAKNKGLECKIVHSEELPLGLTLALSLRLCLAPLR